MGAKTWIIVHAEADARAALAAKPALDVAATRDFVASLFPGKRFTDSGTGDLLYTNPPERQVFAGCFPGVRIAASLDFGKDYPSKTPTRFVASQGRTCLHAMHSVVDWFAFAVWQDGVLQRALSLSPDSGIIEDIGRRAAFEEPFWGGTHPAVAPGEDPSSYPLPFHPLELGEAALKDFFGYQIEGGIEPDLLDPESIPLLHFTEKKAWWRLL